MNSLSVSDNLWRTDFYKQADKYIESLHSKFREKAVIKQSVHDKIIECLTNNHATRFNARFVSWCRTTFIIQDLGTKLILCDVKNKKPVLLYELMYDVYKGVHIETAHAGRDKCLDSLSMNYSWYNRRLLELFIKSCSACQKRKPIVKPMLSKPIVALDFMTRVQMDLIDMRTRPDAISDTKVYRWILQLKDHFTKYCWARPLSTKESRDVYHCVREIFFMFGAPAILQSDNGREFVNDLINSLQSDFPGMHIVHGRPRHPQSQGLIERANAILTDALGKWMEDHSTNHWSSGLPFVIYNINTRTTHTTRKTPYQLVFGQNPRTNMHYWQDLHEAAMNDEVEMNDLIIDRISLNNTDVTVELSKDSPLKNNWDINMKSSSNDIKSAVIHGEEIDKSNSSCQLVSIIHSRHDLYRSTARGNYLKNQQKRQKLYDEHMKKIADSYKNGDLVGIAISRVDRTNCDPKIMPCIIEKRLSNAANITFSLISPYGRIATSFPVHQLIPMSCTKPPELENINFETIPTVTFVQASKMFARGNSTATCDCKTKCISKACPCRRISVACSTKCHSKRGKCSNTD